MKIFRWLKEVKLKGFILLHLNSVSYRYFTDLKINIIKEYKYQNFNLIC